MKVKDLEWSRKDLIENDTLWTAHTEFGRFTVLNRMTGYGYRDTETMFLPSKGALFNLAQGFDIRNFPDLNLEDAIEEIKRNEVE